LGRTILSTKEYLTAQNGKRMVVEMNTDKGLVSNLGEWLWAKIEVLAAEPNKQQAGKTVQQGSRRANTAERADETEDYDQTPADYVGNCAEEWGMSTQDVENCLGLD
jgi:hypothetical protein